MDPVRLDDKTMKIVKIKGGLGNQLFQYSFAYFLQKVTKEEVKIDISSYESSLNDPVRKPRILKTNISLPIASKSDLNQICRFKHNGDMLTFKYRAKIILEYKLNRDYFWEKNRSYIDVHKIEKYKYFDGFWQSWRYVDAVWKKLKQEFVPNYQIHDSTQKMINEVLRTNSVFIGIRRGDYIAEANHYGLFGNDYYQRCMSYITERIDQVVFYVFSNDIPWVKKNIDFTNRRVVFREPENIIDDFEEFLIMANCKHSIIVNSTYYWWGARLNDSDKKIVVAPIKWFFDNKPIDIVPPHWVRIES